MAYDDDVAEQIVNFGRFGITHGWDKAESLAYALLSSAKGMKKVKP